MTPLGQGWIKEWVTREIAKIMNLFGARNLKLVISGFHAQINFSENYLQFGHIPSETFASPIPFMCRMQRFLAILRSFFHNSLLCTFSCHPSPSTILPSSLTSSCHLFLGLSLNLVVPKFIYNTLLGILALSHADTN